jgi:hypothetical protein
LWPKSHGHEPSGEHWQFVVAVGATSTVAFMKSKPCVSGLDVMPPYTSLSL